MYIAPTESANIVILTIQNPHPKGSWNGVHTHTRILYNGIINAGIRCTVINPFSGSKKWLPVFAVRPLLLRYVNKNWSTYWHLHWHFLAIQENLQRYLVQHPTTVVLAQDILSALAALNVRESLGASFKVVLSCHFNYSEAKEWRDKGELNNDAMYQRMLELEVKVLQTVDQVIYNSNWLRQMVEEDRGIRVQSSTVIWCGISDIVPKPVLTRKDFGLTRDDLVFINVGTIEPRKNQIGLIDLFAKVSSKYPQSRLLLVGDGPTRDEIQQKVNQNLLQDKIKLLGFRSDVSDLYKIVDIYIHYATLESFGQVFLEASRAEIPSIAVLGGGITEVSNQLESIIAIPSDNISVSLEAIEPIITNRTLRTELGKRGHCNFQRYFTSHRMIEEYLRTLLGPF